MPRRRANRIRVLLLSCAGLVVAMATAGMGGSATSKPAAQPVMQRTSRASGLAPAPARSGGMLQPAEAGDDEKEILIVQALEQPTSLKIQEVPIVDAVRLLSEKTGVPIEFDRFTLGCLPYGSKTIVTARIENQPLRETLSALLQPLACKYVMSSDKLIIQPRPALFRICRRATWDEVALIQKLYSTPWSKQLADSLQFQFQDMLSTDADTNRKKIFDLAATVGAGSAARVLECASQQYEWEWHPEGAQTIAICTRKRQVELQLLRTVTAQYSEVQLKDVLMDLAQRGGLLLQMEPGVLSALPTQTSERFRLTLENVTLHQAFELIKGETGLDYSIEPDGIRITAGASAALNPSSAGTSGSSPTVRTNPIVGQITFPGPNGTSYSFFIREQDLPADVNAMRQEQLPALVERMRSAMSRPAN